MNRRTSNRMSGLWAKPVSRRLFLESLEKRLVQNADWMNPVDSLDVNADRFISPLDALLIINEVNGPGPRQLVEERPASSNYIDTNGDTFVTAFDALMLVNYLNTSVRSQRTLIDRDEFFNQQEILIELGHETGSRHYRMEINADWGDPGFSRLSDTLAVYVVHPERANETILDRGIRGTSIFSVSADNVEMAPGIVRWDGKVLELDLSSLNEFEKGYVRVKLFNGDPMSDSFVTVHPLENVVDPAGVVNEPPSNVEVAHSPGAELDVGDHVPVEDAIINISNLRFDATTSEVVFDVSVRNGSVPKEELVVVIWTPAWLQVSNASGVFEVIPLPYVNLQPAISDNLLEANELTEKVEVRLSLPSSIPFDLYLEVFGLPSGSRR